MNNREFLTIPPFEVAENEVSFPAGIYTLVLGNINADYGKEEGKIPLAVVQELWVILYHGTESEPADDKRILIKTVNNKKIAELKSAHGVKLWERFPNPSVQRNMAWRANAFYSKFEGCITTVQGAEGTKPVKSVDWKVVQQKVGSVFTVDIIYNISKKNQKSYRNLKYESIAPFAQVMPYEEVVLIENRYAELKATENVEKELSNLNSSSLPADLPF